MVTYTDLLRKQTIGVKNNSFRDVELERNADYLGRDFFGGG